jgi:hypothetical protein
MKKINLLFAIAFFISSNLIAQTTFFDSRVLNGLNASKKIEIYQGLIGKPVPSNYKFNANGFYIYDRNSSTLEELSAEAESEEVAFIVENGLIKVIRIFKLFKNEQDFSSWWGEYLNVFIYEGYDIYDNWVLSKENMSVHFDILTKEEMKKQMPFAVRYFSCIYFYKTAN